VQPEGLGKFKIHLVMFNQSQPFLNIVNIVFSSRIPSYLYTLSMHMLVMYYTIIFIDYKGSCSSIAHIITLPFTTLRSHIRHRKWKSKTGL
jgi:hypothetical protein